VVTTLPLLELSLSDSAAELARDLDVEGLFARAKEATDHAYAPYSTLRIGAALLATNGEIITAGNVENGSYGLTICAERAAVVRAVAQGHRNFVAIAVAADTDRVHTLASCGACLQVLGEFDPDDKLLVVFPEGALLRVARLSELMPVPFRLQPE
jgi:cytidine deaminase